MATFQVITEKTYNGLEYWVNDWYVDAISLTEAAAHGEEIANIEVGFYFQPIVLTKMRAATLPVDVGQFITKTLNLSPATPENDALLPLFDCLRLDLTAAIGRPGRKFLRGCITGADLTDGGNLKTASVTGWQTQADAFTALGYIVKPTGEPIFSTDVYPAVSMRQLRRGSKRRVTPII